MLIHFVHSVSINGVSGFFMLFPPLGCGLQKPIRPRKQRRKASTDVSRRGPRGPRALNQEEEIEVLYVGPCLRVNTQTIHESGLLT